MAKLRVLSGFDVVSILAIFGFIVASQKGSHIKLVRLIEERKQTLIVPNHKELDKGTLRAIFKQACAFVDPAELTPHFFHD